MSVSDLIAELHADPERFYRTGRWCALQEEYDRCASVETLGTLLDSRDSAVFDSAIAIVDETVADLGPIAHHLVRLFTNDDDYVRRTAMACSMYASPTGFANVLALLEHAQNTVREQALQMLSNANGHVASQLLESPASRGLSPEHQEGLVLLASREMATNHEVLALMNHAKPLLRSYGAVAAKRLRNARPELFDELVRNEPELARILS